jgi:hypothetical protein
MAKISGIVRIKVNGELLESVEGATLDVGGFERELMSGHRVYGHKEKIIPSVLACKIVWKFETPIETLRNLIDGLATFESDNGITYQINNLVCTKPPKLDSEIDWEFGGDPAEPQ